MMIPHPDLKNLVQINCAIVTVSDTRDRQSDTSGKLIEELLTNSGHLVVDYQIVKDEPELIINALKLSRNNPDLSVVIFNGGTGIAPRDTTYDALERLLEKTLPGFGEIFRYLSYQEIGSRAIASRAIAGIYQGLLVFSLPGSRKAVELAMKSLIIPEIVHLTQQINS